jgi:ABC-type glutathione transport system ATPase component
VLVVRNLAVTFRSRGAAHAAVRGASFTVAPGETIAIVGESGSGKSATLHALLGLLPPTASVTADEARFGSADLLAPGGARRAAAGTIALVPQDPIGALAPHLTVGYQVCEAIRARRRVPGREARARAAALFEELLIPDPVRRLGAYPHELSGGLNQRVLIAIALALEPAVIFADEPTTALDVTVQREILRILRHVVTARGCALVLVSHDLGVVAGLADRILVMDRGVIVESGSTDRVLREPRSPRARAIIEARRALAGLRAEEAA